GLRQQGGRREAAGHARDGAEPPLAGCARGPHRHPHHGCGSPDRVLRSPAELAAEAERRTALRLVSAARVSVTGRGSPRPFFVPSSGATLTDGAPAGPSPFCTSANPLPGCLLHESATAH